MQPSGPAVLEFLSAAPGAREVLEAVAPEPGVHVVGGAVRDAILGVQAVELDFVVEGPVAPAARAAAERLGGFVIAHARFGTATVRYGGRSFDLAPARRETYPAPGALPEVQEGATLREDLARRDFSVNAMAVRVADGELTAWEGALDDLLARRLRVLHERSFLDDPTRLLRLARYSARLGFEADATTGDLASAAVEEGALDTVSGPRLGAELRLLLLEPQPQALVALSRRGLGHALLHPGFEVEPEVVAGAAGLGSRPAALAACLRRVPEEEVAERLHRLGFPAGLRDAVAEAVARAPALAGPLREAAAGRRSALLGPTAGRAAWALAGALARGEERETARWWLEEGMEVALPFGGQELVAAGLAGPAVGAGLAAARATALDEPGASRERLLDVALRAGRGA